MPVGIIATEATRADCTQAHGLIASIPVQHLIAGKDYDSDTIVEQAKSRGIRAVTLLRKNSKARCEYNKHLYQQRHLVENAFLALNSGGIATRYAKNLFSFLAVDQIRCIALWLKVS